MSYKITTSFSYWCFESRKRLTSVSGFTLTMNDVAAVVKSSVSVIFLSAGIVLLQHGLCSASDCLLHGIHCLNWLKWLHLWRCGSKAWLVTLADYFYHSCLCWLIILVFVLLWWNFFILFTCFPIKLINRHFILWHHKPGPNITSYLLN